MANFFVRSRPTANRAASTAYALGDKIVSTSAVAFLGILFECTTAGTTAGGAEPAWNTTIAGTTADGGVTWTTRGGAGIWLASKTWALGDRVCKVSQSAWNSASSCVWECTTAGAGGGTEPTWPTTITAGTTTQADGSAVWTARACKTWDNANPFLGALLKDAFTNATIDVSAGDTIYVSKSHAEVTINGGFQATWYALPTTFTTPTYVLCVDDTGQPSSPTTLAASAKFTVGGSFNALIISAGAAYIYGCQFISSNTFAGLIQIPVNSSGSIYFDNCQLKLSDAGNTTGRIELGCNGAGVPVSKLVLNNTKISFAHSGQLIRPQPGDITWRNTPSALQGTAPSQLFDPNNGVNAGVVTVEGVDLTGLGANSFFGAVLGGTASTRFQFKNCKLSASTTFSSATNQAMGSPIIDWINCGSSGTNYTLKSYRPYGTIDHELTKVMTGGATDGTTALSWKLASNTSAAYPFALESLQLGAWNDNSGSAKTATVEILTDSLTALNNDDIWLEVKYLADAGDPLGGFADNAKSSVLATHAAQPTSSQAWTTTGIANVMRQKLQVSFTPQQKGPVVGVVKLAKASTTVYVNPRMSIA